VPSVYAELVAELRSPHASIQRVAAIMSKDVGMTAKVLQLVNSAFLGLRYRVTNSTQAVAALGLNTIRSLVLSVQVFSQFASERVRGLSVDWIMRHSMATAALAREIAKDMQAKPHVIDDAFMAGLLHDTGWLLLADRVSERYGEVLDTARRDGMPIWQAEMQTLGANHGQAGAYLLGLWGLPDPIVETLAFHHEPARCDQRAFGALAAVHVADALSQQQDPPDPDVAVSDVAEDYLAGLGLADRLDKWRSMAPGGKDVTGYPAAGSRTAAARARPARSR